MKIYTLCIRPKDANELFGYRPELGEWLHFKDLEVLLSTATVFHGLSHLWVDFLGSYPHGLPAGPGTEFDRLYRKDDPMRWPVARVRVGELT